MNALPHPDRLSLATSDLAVERVLRLRELFPEAFPEGNRVDFERLRQALGDSVDDGPERFGLGWAGKSEAIRAAHLPSTGTLLPVPAESVGWDRAEHAIVEGDNLEVLKLLQRSYHGRVRLIYVDPPYNTGNDFIYADRFADPLGEYLRFSGQVDASGKRLTTHRDTGGRFHSRWLSMMAPRLFLARNLLAPDGFLAVSIGDEEGATLRLLLDEIFGEENHRNTIAVRRYDKNLSRQFMDRGLPSLAVGFEYVLVYSRTPEATLNPVFREASAERQRMGYWKGFWNAPDRPTMRYPLFGYTPEQGQWKWKEEVAREAVRNYDEFLERHAARTSLEAFWEETGRTKKFIRHNPGGRGMNRGVEHWIPPSSGILRTSNWTDQLASESLSGLGLPFDSPKHVGLIKTLVRMLGDPDGLVLDFFAGSGTTAHAVAEVNAEDGWQQRFILVQLPEPVEHPEFATIAEITRERVRRALAELPDAGHPDSAPGFRAFRLAPSGFRAWNADAPRDAAGLAEQLRLHVDPVIEGRTQQELLWELLLAAGFPLSARIEQRTIAGQTVFSVDDGALLVHLEDSITPETLRGMVDAQPRQILCLDHALRGDDALRVNAALWMKSRGVVFRTV